MSYEEAKAGKVKLCRIDPEFLNSMARGQEQGDVKHAEHHWRNGLSYTAVLEAVKRHVQELEFGEILDKETGVHHAALAALGLMYIHHFDKRPLEFDRFDDRPFADRSRSVAGEDSPNPEQGLDLDQTPGGSGRIIYGSGRPNGIGGFDDLSARPLPFREGRHSLRNKSENGDQ
jgi:hypothetical protein